MPADTLTEVLDPIRILIVDAHPIVREGLRSMASARDDIEVAGEAASRAEAVHQVRLSEPDVVVVDPMLPDLDGATAIDEMTRVQDAIRVLILTADETDESLVSAIRSGAKGYLLKDASTEEIAGAIRRVFRGEVVLAPAATSKLAQHLRNESNQSRSVADLTGRERVVLSLIAQGLSNREIARELAISERTARTHVSRILQKMQLANRTQAALYAVQEGLGRARKG